MDLNFLKSQWQHIPVPTKSFAGQTVVVTGSNTGLGLEAARHFVKLSAARVILAVRSIEKGEAAKANIEKSTGSNGVVEVWKLDMSSFDSIKAFAKKCEELDRLDVVLENAGVASRNWYEVEGTETTIRVNVEGTFLLALNLLPILRKSGEKTGTTPVLTITSSEVHAWAKFNERKADKIFDELKVNKAAYIEDRYSTSKLIEVYFVRALATALDKGDNAGKVILNTVNPGLCHSELARDNSGLAGLIFSGIKLALARTTEVGGRTLVWSSAGDASTHGQYMTNCTAHEPAPFVSSEDGKETQKRVYDELLAILEGVQPGISKNI